MHTLRISIDEFCHLTASVSDKRGRHLAVDMLRAVRVAKCGGHGVQDDGSHTRIDWGRRVVIQIDGGCVGQLHVRHFLVLPASALLRRETLCIPWDIPTEKSRRSPLTVDAPALAPPHTSSTR